MELCVATCAGAAGELLSAWSSGARRTTATIDRALLRARAPPLVARPVRPRHGRSEKNGGLEGAREHYRQQWRVAREKDPGEVAMASVWTPLLSLTLLLTIALAT